MSPAPPRISKIFQQFGPRSHNRRPWGPSTGPNRAPSAKSFLWMCPKVKIWFYSGKCLYLISIIYHQPAKKSQKSPRTTFRNRIRRSCAISTGPNRAPRAKSFLWICTKVKIWFYSGKYLYLVRVICHRPAKKSQNLPRSTFRNRIRRSCTITTRPNRAPRAKSFFCLYPKATIWFQEGKWLYLVRTMHHQPLSESQKSRKSVQIATPGNQNLLLERQVPVQTSVQALNTLLEYVRRKWNDFKQVVVVTR